MGLSGCQVWYEARDQKGRPIDWPGRYLDQLLDNGGFETWLQAKGLDVYQPAA